MGSTRAAAVGTRLTLLDRIVARRSGLPHPRPYATRTLRIPMRDGVELGAGLSTPSGTSRGVVVLVGPYGRAPLFSAGAAGVHAAQGYTVLLVSTRGTWDSGGVIDPMRTDAADGHDVVVWLREQPWYGGRFATVGASYLGYTQWALLAEPEADHVAAVVTFGPHDLAIQGSSTGSFRLDLLVWADQMVLLAGHGSLGNLVALAGSNRRLRSLLEAVPLADAATARLGEDAPWLADRVRRTDLSDPYWQPMRQGAALDRATIPILVQAGWQDVFLDQSLEQFTRLHARGQEVALTVGPWAHLDLVRGAPRILLPEIVAWLDRHLAASGSGARGGPDQALGSAARTAPVRVYVTGADVVRALPTWPPDATWRTLHLHSGGVLSDAPAPVHAADASFRFDPDAPTPTFGGPMLTRGGYAEDSALAERPDVLVFTSAALRDDLTVIGVPRVELAHESELPDADIFVRLSDVGPAGRSTNVTERCVRVRGSGTAPLVLDLRGTAHTFRRGHRIRVLVAGGSFPQYARNPGTGENPFTATTLRVNRHTVHLARGASTLRLPLA